MYYIYTLEIFLGVTIKHVLYSGYVMTKNRFTQQPLNEFLPNFLNGLMLRFKNACIHLIVPVEIKRGPEAKNKNQNHNKNKNLFLLPN